MEEIKGEVKEAVSEKEIEKRKNRLKSFFFGWIKDNYDKIFLALLIVAFAVRLYIFFQTLNQPLWWDEADYLSAAKRWGLGLNIRDIWYYRRGFLFPLIGALFFALNLGEIGMRFLIVIFSTGIIGLSYLIISKMFNKKLALWATIALSFSWILLFFSGRVLTDIPAAFFILLSLLFFWKGYVLKQGNKFLYLFGLSFALAVLIRMQSFMFIPPFLVYILIKEKFKALKNKQLWITLGVMLFTLLPQFVMYYLHYGNPIADLINHYMGVNGSSSPLTAGIRSFSPAIFNYFANLPYMMSTLMFIFLLIGVIYFFADLFIGIDKLFKDEILQNKLFVLTWILSLFLIMGYIGSVSYVEQRYITGGLPFLFLIAISPLVLLNDFLVKYFKNKKVLSGIIILLIVVLMIPNITLSNSMVSDKLTSYAEVEQIAQLMKTNSNPGDIIMSTSLPQVTYYAERDTYPYDIQGEGNATGDKILMNYSGGEVGFEQFLLNKKPKFLMTSSIFEDYPPWILTQEQQNGYDILIMPFFNSSMVYNPQTGQIVSLDLKNEIKKGNVTLTLFYPKTSDQMNGIFVYEAEYS
jgi:4-amino-4-deoxy-L-arabinose transferase-like glycosyltransferase